MRYVNSLILSSLILFSCGSDENNEGSDLDSPFSLITSFDLGDNNNASDIKTSVTINSGTSLDELQAFVVPSTDRNMVSEESVSQLSEGRYHQVTVDDTQIEFRFSETLLDFNGDAIANGKRYSIMFLAISGNNQALVSTFAEVDLVEEPYLEGFYQGTWNDNLYVDFRITTNLELVAGKLRGPFYYSGNGTSCCGGIDDGSIEIEVDSDGNVEFSYDQDLVQFRGRACPGEYDGSGTLNDDIQFEINFTGNDCEGTHTGGRIILTKVL